jgi:hypothetical protein
LRPQSFSPLVAWKQPSNSKPFERLACWKLPILRSWTTPPNKSLNIVSHDVKTMIGFARERIAAGSGIAGLFIVRSAALPRALVESLISVWGASTAEEWIDRIVFLPF